MPREDADSDEDKSDSEHDSAEQVTLDALMASEEEKQAAIARVTFDWCRDVRKAGERYQEGASIPVIAKELGVPIGKARRAVKTYYLVFAEPPLNGVRSIAFSNGRRYFKDGLNIEELDAETQVEAEEHVEEFVGRTLLDNELDAVDIEGPVPEMELPSVKPLASMLDDRSMAAMESLKDSMATSSGLVGGGFIDQRFMSQVSKGMQQTTDLLTGRRMQEIQQGMRAAGIGRKRSPALATSAAVSSVVASSAVTGIDPSLFQVMSQPAVRGAVGTIQAVSGLYTPPMVQMMDAVSQPAVQQVMREIQSLSTLPMMQMADLVDQHMLQQLARIIEQLDMLHDGMVGVGAMGAVAARPAVGEDFAQEEVAWSPVQSEPEPAFEGPGIWYRVPDICTREELTLLAALTPILVEAVFFRLQQLYPDSQVTVTYAKLVTLALIELWMWNELRQR